MSIFSNLLTYGLQVTDSDFFTFQCRKTMARIKQILMERKLAYEEAHAILNKKLLENKSSQESS